MRRLIVLSVAALTTFGLVGISCSSSKNTPAAAGTGGASAGGATATGGATTASSNAGGVTSAGGTPAVGGATSTAGGSTSPSCGRAPTVGGSTNADGGAVLGCTVNAVPCSALIADFTEVTDAGTPQIVFGGTFTYPKTAPFPIVQPLNGAWHITLTAPTTGTPQYLGFGIYFFDCEDASAYTGVKFDISGTMTGCTMQYAHNVRDDDDHTTDPKGACTLGSSLCYSPQAPVTIPATVTTKTIPFSVTTAGSPVTYVDPKFLTGVQWQFTVGAADCAADITIDNVSFY